MRASAKSEYIDKPPADNLKKKGETPNKPTLARCERVQNHISKIKNHKS